MNKRKYFPTFAELLDRLSITQLKEVLIPEHREEYAKEIRDILHDINLILKEEKPVLDAETLRALIVLSQYNLHIWHNESNFRKGIKDGNNLELTHGLNGIRNTAKNKIQEQVGGRKDYKVDNVEAFESWVPSWDWSLSKNGIAKILEDTKKRTPQKEIDDLPIDPPSGPLTEGLYNVMKEKLQDHFEEIGESGLYNTSFESEMTEGGVVTKSIKKDKK